LYYRNKEYFRLGFAWSMHFLYLPQAPTGPRVCHALRNPGTRGIRSCNSNATIRACQQCHNNGPGRASEA
jgi:hypothetical protein